MAFELILIMVVSVSLLGFHARYLPCPALLFNIHSRINIISHHLLWFLSYPISYQQTSPTCEDLKVVANDDDATTDKDTPVIIPVLDNDVPAESNSTISVKTVPATGRNGLCLMSADKLSVWYTPNAGFYGVDTCVYEVCDTEDRCDVATITVTVNAASDDVVANDDVVTTDKNTPVDVFPLDNDVGVDGHPLKVTKIIFEASDGECVVISDTVVMYIPTQDFVGSDSCVYEMCDDREKCDAATITVTVVGEPTEPCDDDETGAPTGKPTQPPVEFIPESPAPTPAPSSEPTSVSLMYIGIILYSMKHCLTCAISFLLIL